MGRRPHALVQEYFNRGKKIDDNSNRYSHTCKRCGEIFPKGRVDSLTTHLLRRCVNLTESDRVWVSQQIQSGADGGSRQPKRSYAEAFLNPQEPFAQQQQQTALETLAEVSGHHSSRADGQYAVGLQNDRPQAMPTTVAEAIAEQALLEQLQGNASANQHSQDMTVGTHNGSQYPSMLPQAPSMPLGAFEESTHLSGPPTTETPPFVDRPMEQTTQPLMDPNSFGPMSGQPFQSFNLPVDVSFRTGDSGNAQAFDSFSPHDPPASTHAVPSFGNLTMARTDPTGYHILSTNAKQKPRGRFEEKRRKEVSEIRKQGACLRCRMLKKSCSGETPCKSCTSVGSARIWKVTCVRTKLSDEMTLWAKRVFYRRAQQRLAAFRGHRSGESRAAALIISLSDDSESLQLPLKELTMPDDSHESTQGPSSHGIKVWLLHRDDQSSAKIAAYTRKHFECLTSNQPALVKDVLSRVDQSSRTISSPAAHQTDSDPTEQPKEAKSSKGEQSGLPNNALELWSLTELLVSGDAVEFSMKVELKEPKQMDTSPEPQILTKFNQEIILCQLRATIEEHCSDLAKKVVSELERQLLQRPQTSRLATLLSALVLLSAVERMTAFYRSYDASSSPPPSKRTTDDTNNDSVDAMRPAEEAANTDAKEDGRNTSWPLDTPPASLWQQGEHFADLLTALLCMRALPPQATISPEGKLESVRDFATPSQPADGSRARSSESESKKAAADWLDSLDLEAQPLRDKAEADAPGPAEGMEAWRLRYVAKVLLP